MKRNRIIPIITLFIMVVLVNTDIAFTATGNKPSMPTDFKAVKLGDSRAKVSWGPVSGATGYQVSRATSKKGPFKGIKFTTSTNYTNSNLATGKTYYYKVRAYKYIKSKKSYGKFTSIIPVNIPASSLKDNSKKVVGYYAAWSAYSGFTPDKLDGSKLTHINYSFANIGSDLKISLGYPDIDISNFKKMKALKKKYPKLKTLIAVGGWTWSGRFSDVALTDASRTAFAESCVDFIVKYGFDGIDIDWEYPVAGGMPTNISRPKDKVNFTLLMKKLREKIDARGKKDGKDYILTFAGASSNSYLKNIELSKLEQYIDYANIMTYDIHGTWDAYSDFNAPLYKNSDSSPQYKWSVDQGINAWLKAGISPEKIVMGVPFYGYIYKEVGNTNKGLYKKYSGSSSISYENVIKNYLNKSGYKRYFHSESKVPWLFNGSTFISYEDKQSIGLKAKYIKSKGLGGAMIWELSQDPQKVLLETLYNDMK